MQGNEPSNEVWNLSIEAKEFRWGLVDFESGPVPSPRVYHASANLKISKNINMILVFGGRNNKNQVNRIYNNKLK